MKRHIPMREFDNRFGAPKLTVWEVPPQDVVKTDIPERPWESKRAFESYARQRLHRNKHWSSKFFRINYPDFTPLPVEKWTIFPGDLVQVMVGKDKGKQGVVSHVVREYNAVFVDGLHMTLEIIDNKYLQTKGIPRTPVHTMQPLDPTKDQVMLVDPNDNGTCEAEWHERGDTFIRVSNRTGFEIPLPSQAYITYDYQSKKDYIESPQDTAVDGALKFTYTNPQIKTFEQEIAEEYGIKDDRVKSPTYWY